MSSAANSTLFNAAQDTPNNQMMSNMPAMMSLQPLVPRMQFGLAGGNRTVSSQNMSDIIFLDLSQNLSKALMRLINMVKL
nr:mediator of RNA polymerase II transcription subunit 8 [Tanacetum cinerariifolium]